MHRLTTATLPVFLDGARPSFILFGAPQGEATMIQAIEFAEAWADCSGGAAFGFVDALENVAAARAYGVRVLPTTLLLDRGEVIARFEGVHTSHHFAAALTAPSALAA